VGTDYEGSLIMESQSLTLNPVQKPRSNWLRAMLGRLFRRSADEPPRIRTDDLSSHMLNDMGLDNIAIDARVAREWICR